MRRLALAFALCLLPFAAFARGGGVPYFVSGTTTASNCPFGTALNDGCPGAQASGITPYPNLQTPGILQAVAIKTGGGYTDGTYAWSGTGGTGGCAVEPSGQVTVSGGNLGGPTGISYTIINPGSGCTGRMTIPIPAGAGAGSNGAMVAVVYTKTPHNASTVYNVPGIDYPVGYDRTLTLKDPTIQANLPSGATVSGSTVTIGSNNVTLTGFDFCSHSARLSISANVSGYYVNNNSFCNPQANGQNITLGGSSSGKIWYNDFNGGAVLGGAGSAAAQGCGSNCGPNGAICCGAVALLDYEYNYCYQQDSKCWQLSGQTSGGTIIEKYNVYDTLGNCPTGTGHPCAHGESEYFCCSATQTVTLTSSFNLYWNPFHCALAGAPPDSAGCPNGNSSNLTAIAAIQADGTNIAGTTWDHNVVLMPGPNSIGCNAGSAFAYTGAEDNFDGSQGGGVISNVSFSNNFLDSTADYNTWLGATGTGVTHTNNVLATSGATCN